QELIRPAHVRIQLDDPAEGFNGPVVLPRIHVCPSERKMPQLVVGIIAGHLSKLLYSRIQIRHGVLLVEPSIIFTRRRFSRLAASSRFSYKPPGRAEIPNRIV